ncbi:MAG: hypothetical protein EBZ59_04685 [Planctomycetia bacterium]|nr:hypothetical protein [Planctomycetia bacterium]
MRANDGFFALVLAAGCAASALATPSVEELGPPIDLSAFAAGDLAAAGAAEAAAVAELPLDSVAWTGPVDERSFYIAGIIGASFATLQSGGYNSLGDFPNTGATSSDLLTAGGAAGFAAAREDGQLRVEVEGRGRDLLTGQTNSFPPTGLQYGVRAADGWSVLANVWRDWDLNDDLGWYLGGGIGGGGYRLTVFDGTVQAYDRTGAFAWQAGTGVTYRLFPRTTVDLGYRFFDITNSRVPLEALVGGGAGTFDSSFYASELLLTVRVYEPFRSR